MSKLIDIEDMVFTGQYTEVNGEIYVRLSDYEACLDRQPTYDLEAVVDELNAKGNEFCAKAVNADIAGNDFLKEVYKLSTMAFYESADIVERGGRNE